MSKKIYLKTAALLLLLPTAAIAHTGVGEPTSFMHGLSHPVSGMDHLLAMLAVGLWAVQLGGKALWAVPSSFVILMVIGGLIGFSGVQIPFIEVGILASVLVLGALIASAYKLPVTYSALLVGIFAIFHGAAHGAEMPIEAAAMTYTIGFVLATVLLHSTGIAFGQFFQKIALHKFSRFAGGAIALGGLYLAV
jgi:urease accessory protein